MRIFNRGPNRSPRNARLICLAVFLVASVCLIWKFHTVPAQAAGAPKDNASLVDAFRHVEVASVSDALEQVTGKKMYMSHRMRPIFPSKFAGCCFNRAIEKRGE